MQISSWKMSSSLGIMSNSGWEIIHHSSQQASSMAKFHHFLNRQIPWQNSIIFLKESKLPQRSKDITSFHPSKCIVMITIIFKFIYLFIYSLGALHCCALMLTINQSIDEKNELIF
jgi:hypothetical protein